MKEIYQISQTKMDWVIIVQAISWLVIITTDLAQMEKLDGNENRKEWM